MNLKPRLPEILASSDAARAIVLDLAAGESLSEHEVHERSWLVVLGGEIKVAAAGECAIGGAGLLVEFAPRERHESRRSRQGPAVAAVYSVAWQRTPGAMTIREKLYARRHAAKQADT